MNKTRIMIHLMAAAIIKNSIFEAITIIIIIANSIVLMLEDPRATV